jgi:hypothetical protein
VTADQHRIEFVIAVHQRGRRLVRRPAIAPRQQGPEHRDEIAARGGQAVLRARRRALILAALQDPGLDQGVQPGGEPVTGRAGVPRDLVEPAVAEGDLANRQQRPFLADQVEGPGDGAGAAREIRLRQAPRIRCFVDG